jgi:hypothetical protein
MLLEFASPHSGFILEKIGIPPLKLTLNLQCSFQTKDCVNVPQKKNYKKFVMLPLFS